MPVNPNDKARAAVDAYTRLSRQIREGIENGTVPVDTHQQQRIARGCVAVTQEAADLGDAEALCNLGVYYANGLGVEHDSDKAFEMSLAAAEMELSVAQSNVAHMFAQGSGTPQDYTRALHFWTLAANQNHVDAMYNLGVLYREGFGTPVDLATARGWFKRAAALGHQRAQEEL
jgi:TPR repeat protein